MDNNRDRRRRVSNGNANRVSGPTSALSSFLREHGIRVPNQSRRARREQQQQQQEQQQQQQEQTTLQDQEGEAQQPQEEAVMNLRVARRRTAESSATSTTTILYTPGASTASSSSSASTSTIRKDKGKKRGRKGAKKKGKKNNNDDSDDSDFISDDDSEEDPSGNYKPPATRRAIAAGRALILFCTECKQRFARKKDEDESITTCLNCRNGIDAAIKKAPAKKRRNIPIVQKQNFFVAVPSLQDLCIGVVAKYIDEVESFGIISDDSFNKLAKIICRNRKLNNQTSKLFMEPYRKHLKLYDCTNMTEDALLMLSQFCYQLERLELVYCGRINDKVLESYAERLHHLKALSLSGAFLITQKAWSAFFKKIGSRLEAFELRHSARFDKDCLKALVEYCPNLTSLRLGHLGQLDSDWLELIARLKHLNTLEIAWLSEDKSLQTKDTVDLLSAIGKNLAELSIRGGNELTDEILTIGLLKNCHHLKKLTLELCEQLSSTAMTELFSNWQTKAGLTHLNIARCLLMEDEALKAIVNHSGKTLESLNIHSLERLTSEGLEYVVSDSLKTIDCGFVRSMDDFALLKLSQNCPRLEHINVWGCHALTENVNKLGLQITGREMSLLQELAMLKQFQ